MAYANALRNDEPKRITYGYRPRSLDILAPPEIQATTIIDAIIIHPKLRESREQILSIFQIGKHTFNLTFQKEAPYEQLKESFVEQTKGGIYTADGTIHITKPRQPVTKVNVRAVPTEVEETEVRQKFEGLKCGIIKEIKTIYHKGTQIQNGYRQIWIEEYTPGRIPPFIHLGGAPCKVYLPTEIEIEKCFRCLLPGHNRNNCPNETACLTCKKYGHRKNECPLNNKNEEHMLRESEMHTTRAETDQYTNPKKILHVDSTLLTEQNEGTSTQLEKNDEATKHTGATSHKNETDESEAEECEAEELDEAENDLFQELFGQEPERTYEKPTESVRNLTGATRTPESLNEGKLIIDTSDDERTQNRSIDKHKNRKNEEKGTKQTTHPESRVQNMAEIKRRFEGFVTDKELLNLVVSPIKRGREETSPPTPRKKNNRHAKKK